MRKLAVFAIIIMMAAIFIPMHASAETTEIRTTIQGPKEVLTGEEYDYTVTIQGAPDASKWSCKVTVSGTGSAEPANYTSTESNRFTVHIRAPTSDGNFTITVNGTADIGDNTYWNKVEYKVRALKANTVKVTVYNSGSVDAKGVKISLYIDDKYQSSQTVDVNAGKSSTVSLKWSPIQFSDGVHTMKVVIDPDSNLTFAGGKTTLVEQIYIGQPKPDHTANWIALGILVGAALVFYAYHYVRKKKRMPKRKKW